MSESYTNSPERQREAAMTKLIEELASGMHENWRERRKDKDGIYEKRIKSTNDEEWIAAHGGQTELDIANTNFVDLPRDWREENVASAKVAIEKLRDVLYLIHDFWLDRNSATASSEQRERYSMLPREEKKKDLDILGEAVEVLKHDI